MTYRQMLEQAKRVYFTRLLQQTEGNIAKAARIARVHRSVIYHHVNLEKVRTKHALNRGNAAWQSLGH
jgi:hypothetical protein